MSLFQVPHFTDYRDSNNTSRDGAQAGVDAHMAQRLFAELETRLSRLNHPRGWATKRDFQGGLHRAFMDVSGIIPRKIYLPPPTGQGFLVSGSLPVAVLAMQSGVLKDEAGAHVEVVGPASSYYSSAGSEWCDETEDHIYGLGLISAECPVLGTYSLTWPYDATALTDDKHGLVGIAIEGMIDSINDWAGTRNLIPSLHTGFMRLVAQCKQYFKHIDWIVPSGQGLPAYDPKWYGVHKIHTVGQQLDYWLVYMGPLGVKVAKLTPVYWYPNENDENRVNLLEGIIDIVRDQEVVTTSGTVSLSADEALWYESLLLQNLEFVDGSEIHDLISSEEAQPFDDGWPIYHGVKFNDDCSRAKVVLSRTADDSDPGDYYRTNGQYLCELTVASPGPGEDPRPTDAEWSKLSGGDWSDGWPLSWLNVPRLNTGLTGKYPWAGDILEDRGSGTPIYQVHFDEEPVRFYSPSIGHHLGSVTPWLDMYAPWISGAGGGNISFLGSLPSDYYSYGYTVGPLGTVSSFSVGQLITVDISTQTWTGGTTFTLQNYNGTYAYNNWSAWSSLDGERPAGASALQEYTTGGISLSDTQITVSGKSNLTGVIILDAEAEAVITASYSEIDQKNTLTRAKSYGGTLITTKGLRTYSYGDAGGDGPGGQECAIQHEWGPFNGLHAFVNWRGTSYNPPGYNFPVGKIGRATADVSSEAVEGPPPYWCTQPSGEKAYLLNSDRISSVATGWVEPSAGTWDTYINRDETDVMEAESYLVTKYGTIELSDANAAWSGALIPYDFGNPFVIISALGHSIIYQTAQNSSDPDFIDTAGSDIEGSFLVRHVGVI